MTRRFRGYVVRAAEPKKCTSVRPTRPTGRIILLVSVTLLVVSTLAPLLMWENVAAQSTGMVKDKTVFLHSLNETVNVAGVTTQTIMNTTVGTNEQEITSTMRIIARWLLYPELASETTFNGTLAMTLWWRATAASGASWTLSIREVFGNGSAQTVVSSEASRTAGTSYAEESTNLTINRTFAQGSTVEAHINIVGDAATDYSIAWGSALRDSRMALPAQDYIRVVPQGEGGILFLDSEREPKTNFDPDATNETLYLRVTITDPFGAYDIRWVNLTVGDPNGTAIPRLDNVSMPQVSGFFNSFAAVYEVSWNYSGYSEGGYNVTVYALDTNGLLAWEGTGDFGNHLEMEAAIFYIGAPPIEVHVRVQDGDGVDLQGALVKVLLGKTEQASGFTNVSGRLQLNLAPGIYELRVWWKDTQVASETLGATENIPFDAPFEVTAAVFDVIFRAVDSQGAGLSSAALVVQFPNGSVSTPPFVLDANGNLSLPDMPGGTYRLTVLWTGKVVAEQTYMVLASGVYLASTSVYYVDFTALDASGVPVDNVLITATDPGLGTFVESRLTDGQGRLVSRVPLGTYQVSASWFGIPVMEDLSLDLTGDLQVTLDLSIFDIEFAPIDSRGETLPEASLRLATGAFTKVANTLSAGTVSLRLPSGDYRAVVVWQGAEVFDGTVAVDGLSPRIELMSSVFYLTLSVKDASGSPLAGVFVTVQKDGVTVAAASIPGSGAIEFRLPAGDYRVQLLYRATYLLTEFSAAQEAQANLSGDTPLEVTFSSFPPPVYTTILFYVLVVAGGLASVLVYLLFRLRRGS